MKERIIIPLCILTFIIFRIIYLTPVLSDETIYFNMGKSVSYGLLPYKDFFYAHPPIQILLFSVLFKIVGPNFIAAKIFVSLIGISCILLTYLICKNLFGRNSATISFILFLIFPGFLIFGTQGMGTFEALLFFLFSFYFLLKRNIFIASVFLTVGIFTRYLVILLIPFLLFYLFYYQRKDFKQFVSYLLFFNSISFLILFLFFGKEFFIDTIVYHLYSNIDVSHIANWIDQYLTLGYFTFFLGIICTIFCIINKEYKLLLFSIYPMLYDMSILIIFKQVIYHYFILELSLLFIAVGAVFSKSGYTIIKISLIVILSLSLYTNIQNIDLYFNKNNNLVLEELVDYTTKHTSINDYIFGEPRSLNYVSFITNRKIVNNFFDSDLKHINFIGKEKTLIEIKNAKPKLIFADQFYVDYFQDEYDIVKEWNIPDYYHLILMKLKES
jgi:4-amino-4-deoxy-L-arabinose transferase-like glycosyltransferase